jgi:hypothetical protein
MPGPSSRICNDENSVEEPRRVRGGGGSLRRVSAERNANRITRKEKKGDGMHMLVESMSVLEPKHVI